MPVKKLLFIIHSSAPSGGAEDDIENLLVSLKISGKYELHGLLPDGPRKNAFISLLDKYGNLKWGGFPVIYDGLFKYIKYCLKLFIQWYQIYKFTRNDNYNLCIISVAVLIWPILFLKILGKKQIVFIKETIEPRSIRKVIYSFINRCSVYVIPNCRNSESEFKKITDQMVEKGELEKIKSKYFQLEQKKYLPRRSADLKILSAQEIQHIDEVLARLAWKNASELSDYSHSDTPWRVHKMGEEISYETVFYRDNDHSVRNYEDEL